MWTLRYWPVALVWRSTGNVGRCRASTLEVAMRALCAHALLPHPQGHTYCMTNPVAVDVEAIGGERYRIAGRIATRSG
jgi:hypothetical protein